MYAGGLVVPDGKPSPEQRRIVFLEKELETAKKTEVETVKAGVSLYIAACEKGLLLKTSTKEANKFAAGALSHPACQALLETK